MNIWWIISFNSWTTAGTQFSNTIRKLSHSLPFFHKIKHEGVHWNEKYHKNLHSTITNWIHNKIYFSSSRFQLAEFVWSWGFQHFGFVDCCYGLAVHEYPPGVVSSIDSRRRCWVIWHSMVALHHITHSHFFRWIHLFSLSSFLFYFRLHWVGKLCS